MSALDSAIADRLKEITGPLGWTEDGSEIAPHLSEWRGRWHGHTPLMLKPATTQDVSRILAICNQTATAVVPQGGNTGLVGGQIPTQGEILLSLERMTKIRMASSDDNLLVAEAGVVLKDAQRAADRVERLFPLSLAAEGSCTIGGNVATNAGGVNVLRYGMMRELVLGLEVVLADGSVLDLMRGLRKDNTGYDLKQLFIGAEGTLGIVTAAMLKLFPKPAAFATAYAGIADVAAAVELLNRLQQATGSLVTGFELIEHRALELVLRHIPDTRDPLPAHGGWSALIEISSPAAFDATLALEEALAKAAEDGIVVDAVFAKTSRDRETLWRLRETIPEAQRINGASISNDISVAPSRLAAFLKTAAIAVQTIFPEAQIFSFGHVGDGNLHFTVSAPGRDAALLATRDRIERAVQDETVKLGGSISAEHGLGQAKNKTAFDHKSVAELAVMRMLKRSLDPKNILNRGKLLPPD